VEEKPQVNLHLTPYSLRLAPHGISGTHEQLKGDDDNSIPLTIEDVTPEYTFIVSKFVAEGAH